jgi:hypothetical protein
MGIRYVLSALLAGFLLTGVAVVTLTIESHPSVTTFITRNASHFVGKTRLEVFTPQEWLAQQSIPV